MRKQKARAPCGCAPVSRPTRPRIAKNYWGRDRPTDSGQAAQDLTVTRCDTPDLQEDIMRVFRLYVINRACPGYMVT